MTYSASHQARVSVSIESRTFFVRIEGPVIYHQITMRKEASLPVRLAPDLRRRLDDAAERLGLSTSALIRLLARSFMEEFGRCNGRIEMPPDWPSILRRCGDVAEAESLRASVSELRKAAEDRAVYTSKSKPKRKT